jgi:amino acid transporter
VQIATVVSWRSIVDFFLGRPIPTEEEHEERVGTAKGVSILGLDALASAAYGPEALLTVLIPLGVAALHRITLLTLLISALLTVVFLSYRQTISAYPNGGGSYTVAKENLGRTPSLVAAAALSLDYVLNVAVAVSAGVGALVSAAPELLPHTLLLCFATLLALVLVNLRGVRASGALFLLPTCAFIGLLALVLGIGLVRSITQGGHPAPVVAPPAIPPAVSAASLWLVIRAFAAGCTAMTGVEAVSNGVPIFRDPPERGARHALGAIIATLITLLVSISIVCRTYHVSATPPGQAGYQSVLSQITGAVVGRGTLYALTMGAVIALLLASANTSFADFPRLCRLLALDGFLPENFAHRGRRLAFSRGILFLGVSSAILLGAFHGLTEGLIPLFAFGAFLAFTMSQAGMVVHWRRQRGHIGKLTMNAVGAGCTGVTCIIIVAAKFVEGAWISVVLVVLLIGLLAGVRRHRTFVARVTHTTASLEIAPSRSTIAVVPMRKWTTVSLKALSFAVGFAPEVIAVQVITGDQQEDDLTDRWDDLVVRPARELHLPSIPRLVVLPSEYRRLYSPLLDYVSKLERDRPDRQVAVVVSELVDQHWWDFFVHGHEATVLRELLLFRGGPQVVIVTIPWYMRAWRPERRRLTRRRLHLRHA